MARKKKSGFIVSLFLLAIVAGSVFYVYQKFFTSIKLKNKNYTYIFIENEDTFEDVISDINAENIIESTESFEWLARKMELDKNIHPGRYRIINGMNMRQIVNLIKYNKQEKVKLTYNSQVRTLDEFIEYTDEKLALDASALEDILTDEKKLYEYFRLDPENCFGCVSPGAYEVSWAITAEDLFKMLKEKFHRTWNSVRLSKAKKLGLTVPQVLALASIVQSESAIESEQEKIAGVYMNRLRKDMLLQADPTLKFANKTFDTQRVLDGDKDINSPYNTYLYKGLPPGPICLVTLQAIDATLNHKKHNYLFFCAKPDLKGFSEFTATYDEHRKCATAYQKALDKLGINR